ncbi:uncharacterized protein LOC143378461 [Andrena cerasifolii]|uniref:uncharacterized protein LOC143378461 n=1 Tax=Andrena cerasifolii TaxID=2819439 RepID=UPI0040382003
MDDEVPQAFTSDQSPSHSGSSESRRKHPIFDSVERFDGPRDWLASIKKEPRENKHSKKLVSPFYAVTDKDAQKYRDVVFKSGVPYCQEIKARKTNRDTNAKDSMVCYKCKNPKNGATYEQCSYVSQPLADSSNVEEVSTPSSFRSRRSSGGSSGFRGSDDYRKHDSPYRFNEKIFSEATDGVPAQYRQRDEECEKVVKDSMVCMVCRDTKSNGKYEQCSYVRQPSEKAYAYSKSSSFKNPEQRRAGDNEEEEEAGRKYSESKPVKERPAGGDEPEKQSREESKDSSSNCKKVERDSKTCTVCKDPETGGNYEKCSYTYQPDDKVYKFSRSKSFGGPRGSSSKEDPRSQGDMASEKLGSESDDYHRDYSIPESFYEKPQPPKSSSYFKEDETRPSYYTSASEESRSVPKEEESSDYDKSKSESERIAENIEPSNCKEVEKDSMTCKVCKDPKTGSNSEQCSYKYEPTDKSYSYTKSKSFGSPTESGDKSQEASDQKESQEPSYKDRSYSFSTEKSPYASASAAKRQFRESSGPSEARSESKGSTATESGAKKPDADFYDAFKKKAEIQKFLQAFRKEDRSNCKKMMRDKMTCYQCVDEKGFRKEECAFVTSDETGGETAPSEAKEAEAETSKKVPRSIVAEDQFPAEPEASASENIDVKGEAVGPGSKEERKEAEAYEYVAETRPVYDRVLGFTLPAFMLSTSEHEKEFDRALMSGRV